VTLFQLGPNVNVGLNLTGNSGNEAVDIRKGTCKDYADSSTMPLGVAQDTRLSNTKLEQLSGNVLLIHKTAQVTSPPNRLRRNQRLIATRNRPRKAAGIAFEKRDALSECGRIGLDGIKPITPRPTDNVRRRKNGGHRVLETRCPQW